jgi:two-component system sensor histidine kinase/response regulator
LVSLDGGQIVFANDYMQRYYFNGDYRGLKLDEYFSFPDDAKIESLRAALDSGQAWTGRVVPYHNKHGISSVELMMQRDTESPDQVWLYTMENPAVNGSLRFSSRSEMKILQVLLDNTLEYVFLRDPGGRFIIINKAFRLAVEVYDEDYPVGQTIDNYVSAESAEWISKIDAQVYETGQPSVNKVFPFVFNNGTKHWLQMTTVPVQGARGHLVGSVSVARDISDLKHRESELRTAIENANAASRAKGEFLAAMSHEIRTPINGIIGASELCQETRLDLEQREYLATVVQCSDTLLALVNDVLDFSKIEAGQLSLEKLNFCPVALLDDVAGEFAQVARRKGLELIVISDEALPRYVMGDPTRVKQILYNLIGNSVKFTAQGEIVIRAQLIQASSHQAQVLFTVADTGIGISELRREAIFKSFTQADMSTTRKYGGTGLGLSICKELVHLMHGSIEVDSRQGEGSTFAVELPFDLVAHDGVDAIPFNPELAGLRVLVVDGNEISRSSYKQMCASWGYSCGTAKDAMEALAMLEASYKKREPYRLVLLDHQPMPGLTGLDFAGLLSNRPDFKQLRIILLSSSLNRAELQRAEGLGISRALSKPVKRATLLEVILQTFGIGSHGRFGVANGFSPAQTQYSGEAGASLNILLAEDNEVNQVIAVRRLERLGHQVVVASNGTEVLELLEQKTFDCILMDIQMPEMDGYEAVRCIRENEIKAGGRAIYIIAMTAHAMKGDREFCIAAGMNDYISKPFRVDRLKEVLADAVDYRDGHSLPIESQRAAGGNRRHEAESSFVETVSGLNAEDREDIFAVSELFIDTIPAELEKLQVAVEQAEYLPIYRGAHAIKGVVGIFKSNTCLNLAKQLEQASEREDLHQAQELMPRLSESLRKLLAEVQDWVGSQESRS